MIATTAPWDQLSVIHRTADELATLLDDYRPAGPLQRSDVASARNYVASVTAALDRLNDSIRKGLA